MVEPASRTALTFMAHPDDAELLCGGVLMKLADAGWDIHIATCTPGDCGTVDRTRWEISAVRTEEGRKAAAQVGGTYHCLDEHDLTVVYDKPTVAKTLDLFRRVAPSLVLTHAPKDYMMDHEVASQLARCASFGYGAPNASAFPLKETSTIPWLYYADPVGATDPLGQPVTPTTVIDISGVIERKAKMLACHESQRQWLRAHHGMDEYIEAMRRHAALRGEQHGCDYAEGYIQHRGHPYPQRDLLTELLG